MIGTEKICRGQVWYVQMNEGAVGTEMKVGRPVVIMSSQDRCDKGNLIHAVYMTTVERTYKEYVELVTPRRKSWAVCDQIVTFDKQRLSSYMCKLTASEMEKIESVLSGVLGLQLESESEPDEELINLRLENDLLKRTYQKAVEMLAEFKFVKDAPVIPKVEQKVEEPKEWPEPELDLSGLKEKFAVYDAKKPKSKLKIEKVKKVNVNTASAKEIHEKTGMSLTVCYGITGTRKELGPYETLNSLLLVDRFKQSHLDKYGEMLEV